MKNDSMRARLPLRLALCLAVITLALSGCKSAPPSVENSVTSVSEEGGIRFTPITDENDAVSVADIVVQGNRRIAVVQKVFDVSRDGNKVAYLATRDKKTNIYVKNVATGARGTLQRTFRDNVMDVTISPDGRLLAFSDRREGNLNVYLTSADSGSAIRQVTQSPLDEREPAFSTDGRSLLYVQTELTFGKEGSKTGTGQKYMWVYDIARGTQTQYAEGYNGEFSPDSRKVVFTRNNKETQARELWTMELDNGQEVLIASDKNRNFMDPVMSPDGSKIAFTSASKDNDGADRNLDIYIINADGTKLTQLTFHPGDDMLPRWGPDGKSIYFLSQRGSAEKKWNIWRMDLRGDMLQ